MSKKFCGFYVEAKTYNKFRQLVLNENRTIAGQMRHLILKFIAEKKGMKNATQTKLD